MQGLSVERGKIVYRAIFLWLILCMSTFLCGCHKNVPLTKNFRDTHQVNININSKEKALLDGQVAQAVKEYQHGNYSHSLYLLNKVLEKDPQHVHALSEKGLVLALQGHTTQGFTYTIAAHKLDNQDATIDYNLAVISKLAGHIARAKYWYGQVLVKVPNHAMSLYNMATIYADQEERDEAYRYLQLAIKADPSLKKVARTQDHWQPYTNDPRFIAITQ